MSSPYDDLPATEWRHVTAEPVKRHETARRANY
jgi:hypothetical protein